MSDTGDFDFGRFPLLSRSRPLVVRRLPSLQRGEQAPLEEQEAAARVFLDCWGGIGDAFAAAEPEELRAILQHSVEVIEFRSVNPGSRQGEYAIRMFPEVDASFGQDNPPAPPGGDQTGSGARRKKHARLWKGRRHRRRVNRARPGLHKRRKSSPSRTVPNHCFASRYRVFAKR